MFKGDYGTGKTLILESAANKLKEEGKNVFVISALDYENSFKGYLKRTDDVLDILLRHKFGEETFRSIADLRNNLMEERRILRKPASTLGLFSLYSAFWEMLSCPYQALQRWLTKIRRTKNTEGFKCKTTIFSIVSKVSNTFLVSVSAYELIVDFVEKNPGSCVSLSKKKLKKANKVDLCSTDYHG